MASMELSDLFLELELQVRAPSIQTNSHMDGLSNPKPVIKSYAQAISEVIASVSSVSKKKR